MKISNLVHLNKTKISHWQNNNLWVNVTSFKYNKQHLLRVRGRNNQIQLMLMSFKEILLIQYHKQQLFRMEQIKFSLLLDIIQIYLLQLEQVH